MTTRPGGDVLREGEPATERVPAAAHRLLDVDKPIISRHQR